MKEIGKRPHESPRKKWIDGLKRGVKVLGIDNSKNIEHHRGM